MCCLMMHMKAVESWSEAEADNVERDVIMNVMGPFKIYCNGICVSVAWLPGDMMTSVAAADKN